MTTESPRLNFKRSNLKAMEMESIQYPDWKGDDTWQVDHWPENFPISRLQGISGASGALWLALRKKKNALHPEVQGLAPNSRPCVDWLTMLYRLNLLAYTEIKKKVQQRKTRFITIPPNIEPKSLKKNRHTPQKLTCPVKKKRLEEYFSFEMAPFWGTYYWFPGGVRNSLQSAPKPMPRSWVFGGSCKVPISLPGSSQPGKTTKWPVTMLLLIFFGSLAHVPNIKNYPCCSDYVWIELMFLKTFYSFT